MFVVGVQDAIDGGTLNLAISVKSNNLSGFPLGSPLEKIIICNVIRVLMVSIYSTN